ncbi:MAG: MFS transporter [Deltaproteobacteria bacterium]|nr:MFS transporter [Deltaproteobacteria bacterium]
MRISRTFIALKHPNYRLWFFGQMVSLFGTWMQMTAQSFLVFELTKSPAFLGYVSFAFGLPSWIFMLYGGVIADRIPRRTLMLAAQSSMMVLAFILTALTLSGLVQPWHIIVFVFLLGVANAFDAPARQAFIFELVAREDITNAVALNSTLFNLSAVVGPAVAGIVYTSLGPGWCFAVNGISFLAVIAALLMMKLEAQPAPPQHKSAAAALKEGIVYAFSDRNIWPLMCLVGATTLFGFAFATLIPAWAVTVLGGDATTNGLLQSARGAGAVLSALLIASLGRFSFRGKLLTSGTFSFPIFLFLFAIVSWLPLSLFMLVLVGIALQLIMNLANALLQSQVEDHMRGRVMSIYSLTHFGFMPIGGLLAGILAELAGEPFTVIISAIVFSCCILALWLVAPQLKRLK